MKETVPGRDLSLPTYLKAWWHATFAARQFRRAALKTSDGEEYERLSESARLEQQWADECWRRFTRKPKLRAVRTKAGRIALR